MPTDTPKKMTAEERIANLTRLSLMERHELSRLGRSYGAIEKLTEQKIRAAVKAETERCCKLMCHWCDVDEPAERTEFGWYHFGGVTDCAAAAIREGEKGE